MHRRTFIRNLGGAAAYAGTGAGLFKNIFDQTKEFVKISILHTNDVHNRIAPLPINGNPHQGLGGLEARLKLISEIREKEENVLLFDAGNMMQGSSSFSFEDTAPEYIAMNSAGYQAATFGSHDFDGGLDWLAYQIGLAEFNLLCCNYVFQDNYLREKVRPYTVFEIQGIRIGVFGLGTCLAELIPSQLYGETRFLDPIESAKQYAATLRYDERCNYVICLSHLGFSYEDHQVSDVVLAEENEHIDLIIGGNTQTLMTLPHALVNSKGNKVLINQVGWAGIMLGHVEVYFERNSKEISAEGQNLTVCGIA